MTSGLFSCSKSTANGSNASAPSIATDGTQAAVPDRVVVYYFHGKRRCPTCLGIQETISKTIQERFVAEITSAALSFVEVNYDEPENRHFVKDFNLSFSTMVIVANKGQETIKWENLNQVWDFAHNQQALTEYTEKNIRSYLALLKGK